MALAMFGARSSACRARRARLRAHSTLERERGGRRIPVHVTEDGVAKEGVVVTAYREAEGIATATTDAQGDAIVPRCARAR